MATKGGLRGRYICKVGFYDVYAKDTLKTVKTKQIVTSTDYCLYHAKQLKEKGLKSKELAIAKAKELLGEKYQLQYGL
mgnify:CR=1 FL=1|jgi:predicted transglutaminase-like cysteine proteinase|tara:strand:+ start:490 stop:723 length:234 start_codon:yes stop_codon:yes gene_type:complete